MRELLRSARPTPCARSGRLRIRKSRQSFARRLGICGGFCQLLSASAHPIESRRFVLKTKQPETKKTENTAGNAIE